VTGFPSWLVFIDSVLPVTSLFVLHGNVHDLHPLPGVGLQRTPDALRTALERSGIATVVCCSPLHGLRLLPGGDEAEARRALGDHAGLLGRGSMPTFSQLAEVVGSVVGHRTDAVALVIDYLSQAAAGAAPDDDQGVLHLELLRAIDEGMRHPRPGSARGFLRNPVAVMVDRPGDLPAWLLSGDGVRQVPIPVPDLSTRSDAVELLMSALVPDADGTSPEARADIARRFTDSTHGLTLRALTEIVQLMRDADIPAGRIEDAARRYRVGVTEDRWRTQTLRERVASGEADLTTRVKGQPQAVRHALDILVRSVVGMTAAHKRERGSGPRGVMFFAGPTGVGKTELAKSIAELLFGDESSYKRFDMSEFADAESDARLIGAPPGYKNHEAGGELTNAVRERPFSVLLFDEIEKAHPRILDKFLQILSDGRLSDGSGDTVYFSEALIVFTSNLGVGRAGTTAEDSFADTAGYRRAVLAAVHDSFRSDLNRPELLGRIGDNIVVFDYLTPETARVIADGYVDTVLDRVRREQGVRLTLPPEVRAEVLDRALADLSLGARGVGNNLETAFVNPLARAVFEVPARSSLTIRSVSENEHGVVTAALS